MKNLPIAVFDSGLGGISVLRRLVRVLPGEDFLYFGDSANAPYGPRATEEIRALALRHADRLFSQGVKALVVACNTATSAAISDLRERWPERVIVGIEPALKPAVDHHPHGRILVLATEATLRERKFSALLEKYAADCEIYKCPCPKLVDFVERGELSGPEPEAYLQKALLPYLHPEPDAVVLGCTHFPFLAGAIRSVVGQKAEFFDGADGTAKETRRRLSDAGLLRSGENGKVTLTNSLSTPEIIALSERLLAFP